MEGIDTPPLPQRIELTFSSRTGGATKLAPTGGFGDPALEKLMKFSKADSSTSADSDSSSTSGDNSSLSPKITTAPGNLAKKTNTGPIAGGVIGGLAVLGALGFGIFLLKRNKGRAATIAQGQAREREDMEQSAIAVHEVHEAPDNQKFAQIYEAPSETRYYGNIPELSNTRQ